MTKTQCLIFSHRGFPQHPTMKKIIPLLLLCISTQLFSQKDSIDPEIKRFQVMRDSMYQAALVRESTSRVQLEEGLQKARRGIAESKQKEMEEATNEVVARQAKEQRTKRKTMLLALAGFSVTVAIAGFFFRQKRKNSSS